MFPLTKVSGLVPCPIIEYYSGWSTFIMQLQEVSPASRKSTGFTSLVDAYLALRSNPTIQKAAKGHILVHEAAHADHSMLLLEGWVALSKTLPDGGAQIYDVMLPGDFALVGAKIAPIAAFSVEALTDIRFIVIPPEQVNGPDEEQATVRSMFAAMIVLTQARTSELLLRMGRSSATCRVAYALLELYVRLERIGQAQGGRFHLPLTQHQIGEFAGLSNVHVCRTMRRFERDGLITYEGDHDISLNELDALSEIAEIDLALLREEILLRRPQ